MITENIKDKVGKKQEIPISMTDFSSNIYEPKINNKVINNTIHG